MKLFKPFLVTLLFIAFICQFALANPLDDPTSELRSVVVKLLTYPSIHTKQNQKVRISFFVTADEQLVVLKTDARDKKLDELIKERMNYHKIDVKDLEVNRIVHIKVHFQLDRTH